MNDVNTLAQLVHLRTTERDVAWKLLQRLVAFAVAIDTKATLDGRGWCNGLYAGNQREEGCPLCDAYDHITDYAQSHASLDECPRCSDAACVVWNERHEPCR